MPSMRTLFSIFAIFTVGVCSVHAGWEAGLAKVDITPTEPVPLAGYGGKTRMSNRIEHPIWIKALALKDETGAVSVIVTADLVGLSDKMIGRIAEVAQKKHGVTRDRLILNSSHNHSCPVTEDVLWLYYEFTPEEAAVKDRYTERLYGQYDEVIGAAIADLAPADLAYDLGLAGVDDVRVGKHITLQVNADSPENAKAIAEEASKKLLSNAVMEYFEIEVN